MKIVIESTPEIAHANGLPVRVWTGTAERGTPLLVLVTRIAAPDDGHPDDLAELKASLTEPPTRHGVYGETPVVAEPRSCTVCLARNLQRPATHVARNADGLEWFECGAHDATDNVAETIRVALEPIAEWFDRHELPLPGGVYRGPASQREPWASIIARKMLGGAVEQREPSWLVKDFWILYQSAKALADACSGRGDGRPHPPLMALEAQLARMRPAFETCEAERLGAPDRLTAAEREALTALHRWLHSPGGDCDLIEAAAPYHDQVEGESPAECERLEAEEQRIKATDAALAMARHDERRKEQACGVVEPPLPHELIRSIVADDRAGEQQTGSAFVLSAMRGALLGWHAKHAHPETIALTGRLGAPIDEPARSAWLTGYRLGAGLDAAADLDADDTPEAPVALSKCEVCGKPCTEPPLCLSCERAGGSDEIDAADAATAQRTCRVCKCTDDDCSQCIAKTGEPCHWVERDLCSACDTAAAAELRARGLDLAAMNRARLASGLPTIGAVGALARLDATREVLEATAPAPLELTDELRAYAREHLHYRAPELLTARDRAILAAYDAEETARATSPDSWLGGDR